MFKKSLLAVSLFLFLLGPPVVNSLSKTIDVGPETMELKTITGKKPARFPHRKHQESFTCEQCHHSKTGNGMQSPYVEGMKINKCAFCHNDNMTNPNLNSFKLAAHGLCKECHKQNSDSAPTRCSGCHIK